MDITKTRLNLNQKCLSQPYVVLALLLIIFLLTSLYLLRIGGSVGRNHKISDLYEKIRAEISSVVVGKGDIELTLMLALIAGGHVLIEGFAGNGKTKTGTDIRRSHRG